MEREVKPLWLISLISSNLEIRWIQTQWRMVRVSSSLLERAG
jgi:hypothetical protein